MGNAHIEASQLERQISTEASSISSSWLDQVLCWAGEGAPIPWASQNTELYLKCISFDTLLSAIERAGTELSASVAVTLYKHWIEANRSSPFLYAAWFNMGVNFAYAGDIAHAAEAYNNALSLRPDLHTAAINLGLLLEAHGQVNEALTVWQRATQSDAARVALEIQQGRLLEKIGRLEDAEKTFHRVLLLDPQQPDVVHHWVHIRQKMCKWPVTPDDIPGLSPEQLIRKSGPLGILALTDNIHLQCEAATAWINRKTQVTPERLAPTKPYPHNRIRIGYLSSDFCSHAMSYLITELFECHDRSRFQVFGYCSSLDDGSQLRQRVLASFDHRRFIRDLSDEQAARVIRDDEIDILIDLNGITEGSRLPILRWRPAPIQATYLGFIGPVPLPELDYLLCDSIVIPREYEHAYKPQPLLIGNTYQANDGERVIGQQLTRAELGLPCDRFVFCCFCKHYKITHEMFAAWMSILRQANNSVLWLAADNPFSQANLIAAAELEGITSDRIIFSERAAPDIYMSRLALADLFLDTFPYNAGTVASDAIRMQLPLVTLCGQAFASRMATSLLQAVGAAEGITTSLEEYVRKAVGLAGDPTEYSEFKALFTTDAWDQTIGHTKRFTSEFEDALYNVVTSWSRDERKPSPSRKETKMETALEDYEQNAKPTHDDETHRSPLDGCLDHSRAALANDSTDWMTVLHVGCGPHGVGQLPAVFSAPRWREVRLDIDPKVHPDVVADVRDMHVVANDCIDAVYSSHCLMHLYPHDVELALQEMRRVLKRGAFALIRLPDLQEVARHVACGKLEDTLYVSGMGPVSALDILFGYRASLAKGNLSIAHHTGFTDATLGTALIRAGFAAAMVQREPLSFSITAVAFCTSPNEQDLHLVQARLMSGQPSVLYAPHI